MAADSTHQPCPMCAGKGFLRADIPQESTPLMICMIGGRVVGQTSLGQRFAHGEVGETHSTIGVDFHTKKMSIGDQKIRLQIYDLNGQDRFWCIISPYLRDIRGVLLIFDLTDKHSFEHVKGLLRRIRRIREDDVPILLVGNKCDLENRQVSEAEIQELGLEYIETSATRDINVTQCFEGLVRKILSPPTPPSPPASGGSCQLL